MDHREIEEHEIVDRYLRAELDGAQAERFELHLLECTECFERVKWEDDLGTALRAAGAEEAVRVAVRSGLVARFRQRLGGPLMFGLLAVAALPSLLLIRERARLHELIEPQINTAIYALGTVRDSADVTTRLTLSPSPEWVVLRLELPHTQHPAYRATLTTEAGKQVWQGGGLKPDTSGALVLILHSDWLPRGGFVVRLEGSTASGESIPSGEYPFQVVTAPR